MRLWSDRVTEEINLFNPAFCSTLLIEAVEKYNKRAPQTFPFALSFLVLPIVLHRGTRSSLPRSTVTSLLSWVQDNKEQLVDFSSRVQRLDQITRETITFAIQHEALKFDNGASLITGDGRMGITPKRTPLFTEEAKECTERAGFLGRWFASAGTTATIFSAWGIRP
ncbi:MAG: three component ABC system middle component [Ferrovibrio sp.]|uniref:three component ABC system middle component n=1 Tax=Ferrovibrio sp. TaxID=1917215 RepID=UPI003919E36B